MNVRRGDKVHRGQVLAELQSRAEKLAVASARFRSQMEGPIATAQNRIDCASKKFARAEELQRSQMGTNQARDEAQAELQLAQAELQAATENRAMARIEHQRAVEQLAMRTMTSPFNGVVVDRLLNPGGLAEAGSGRKPVLKLAQIDPLRVDIFLPGALFGKVKPRDRVVVTPVGVGGRHVALVRMVDRVVDAASGTFVARIELPNPTLSIPGGIRCQAEIEGVSNPAAALRALRP